MSEHVTKQGTEGSLGRLAVVIGGSVAGLAGARALSPFFERVLVLDRDDMPSGAAQRKGAPQARHAHGLLAGGLEALGRLFPGFRNRLVENGATRMIVGLDLRLEMPGFDPFPARDLGFSTCAASRPLIEHCLRVGCQEFSNVEVETNSNVLEILHEGERVVGVRYARRAAQPISIAADLVLDASGGEALTLELLRQMDVPLPPLDTVGVDVGYATACFRFSHDRRPEHLGYLTLPHAPRSSRSAFMLPVGEEVWMLSLGGRLGDYPPGDPAGFMDFAKNLRTPTIFDAILRGVMEGGIDRFRLPESRRRMYASLQAPPRGLLCIGDVICRFNPVYGQGMTVAAQEALALHHILNARAAAGGSLENVESEYFQAVADITETPWLMSAVPDFVFPDTVGKRPAQLQYLLRMTSALRHLAAEDAEIHAMNEKVSNLVSSSRILTEGQVGRRVLMKMASMGTAQA